MLSYANTDQRKRYLAGLGASPRIAYDDVAINRLLLTCQQKFLAAQEALADEQAYLAKLQAMHKANPHSVPAATIAWYVKNLLAHKNLFAQAAAHCRQHIRPRKKPPVYPPHLHRTGWGMGDDSSDGGFVFGPPSAPPPIYGPDAPPPDITAVPSYGGGALPEPGGPPSWLSILGPPSQPAPPPGFFTFGTPTFAARNYPMPPVPNLPNVAPPTQAAMIISSGPPRPGGPGFLAGSLIPGVPNTYLLYGGGALVLIMALGKKGRR